MRRKWKTRNPIPSFCFFFLLVRRPAISTLFPYTTLFRSLLTALVLVAEPLFRSLLTALVLVAEPLFRSEERFSRNAETDLVCRLLLEKKKKPTADLLLPNRGARSPEYGSHPNVHEVPDEA